MCGPSDSMKLDVAQGESLTRQLQAEHASQFADQKGILDSLNKSFNPILAAGPSQQGFSPQELAAYRTQAINSNGAASRNAIQAGANALAGRGGDSGLQSGVDKQIMSTIRSNAASNLANQQLGITQADYQTGRKNYFDAAAGENALAGHYNPGEFSGQAQTGISQNFGMNKEINAEQNAKNAAIMGGITSLGIDAATFGLGGIANLGAGESFGEGAGDFFKGGIAALSGGK